MQMTYPNLPDSVAEKFTELGAVNCYCAYYVTKPHGVLARVLDAAIAYTLGNDASRGLVNVNDKIEVLSSQIQCGFIDGNYTLSEGSLAMAMEGSYLFIATPIYDESVEAVSKASESVETCAAFISLLHGEFVATERHFAGLYSLIEDKVTVSQTVFVRQTDQDEFLNQRMAIILDEANDCSFLNKPTCLSLVRRAHHEQDSSVKFMFMWLALESAIGNGKDRKNFAVSTMKSDVLNDAINNLRYKRSEMLHDGNLVGLSHKEYLLIKCIIIMALSQNNDLRTRLLSFLTSDLIV